ncbi:hypothetical protein [Aeromonas aquatica]|jgi:cobalamin biosynthesis protein CobD/CbiB|nr:hypothetical protein [Aeromonas aquatica]
MGYFTAFLPARAGLRQPSVQHIGAPSAQADAIVNLPPPANTEGKA